MIKYIKKFVKNFFTAFFGLGAFGLLIVGILATADIDALNTTFIIVFILSGIIAVRIQGVKIKEAQKPYVSFEKDIGAQARMAVDNFAFMHREEIAQAQEKFFSGECELHNLGHWNKSERLLIAEPSIVEPSFRNELYMLGAPIDAFPDGDIELIAHVYKLQKEGKITEKIAHRIYITIILTLMDADAGPTYKPYVVEDIYNRENKIYLTPEIVGIEPLTRDDIEKMALPIEEVVKIIDEHELIPFPVNRGLSEEEHGKMLKEQLEESRGGHGRLLREQLGRL